MKCIIIEDQLPAQRVIQKYLTDLPSFELVGTFGNAVEALDFLNGTRVDLIFLDINLPKISGITFIKHLSHPPQVIITSAYSEYALEGFELEVVDYLLKPFSFERFLKAVSRVKLTEDQASVFVKNDKEFFQIQLKDVCYIKGDDDFSRVYTSDKMYLDTRTLKKWLLELPDVFIRIHKSYIVNKSFITRISGQRVFLEETELPIGRTYKNEVMKLVGAE